MKAYIRNENCELSVVLFLIWSTTIILNIRSHSSWVYLSVWILTAIIGILYCNKENLSFSLLEKNWFIFVIFTVVSTLINSLMNRYAQFNQASPIITELRIYVFPLLAIFLLTKKCDKLTFLIIYRNFVSFFSLLGLFEIVTHNQFYSKWITSLVAKNNFQIYGNISLADYRTTLIFYHPYFYSVILVIFLICLLYIPFKNKFFQISFFILGIINLLFTQTRASWISFLIVLLLFLTKNNKRESRYINLIKLMLIILLIILFTNYIVNAIPGLPESMNKIIYSRINVLFNGNIDQASGARLGQLNLIQHNNTFALKLIGGGENYAINILQIYPVNGWNLSIDNQYLMTYMDYGLIGLSIYLIFVFNSFKYFFKTTSKLDNAIALSLISILISSIFFSTYKQSEINYLMFILIGLTGANSPINDLKEEIYE